MRRAEEALFGKPEPFPETGMAGESTSFATDQQPQRRILQAIVPDAEIIEPAMPLAPEPRRRGRKPGSKNRPKAEVDVEVEVEASIGKRRRGRPRKHPEGEVRSVEVTPELASAALEVMARSVPPAPAPVQAPSVAVERPAPAVRPEGKRPRGRPRKRPLPAAADSAEDPPPILAPGAMSAARIINRYASEDRTHAGRRWMRRLRGYAHPDHVSRRQSRP